MVSAFRTTRSRPVGGGEVIAERGTQTTFGNVPRFSAMRFARRPNALSNLLPKVAQRHRHDVRIGYPLAQ
jgi:hypothetical protein